VVAVAAPQMLDKVVLVAVWSIKQMLRLVPDKFLLSLLALAVPLRFQVEHQASQSAARYMAQQEALAEQRIPPAVSVQRLVQLVVLVNSPTEHEAEMVDIQLLPRVALERLVQRFQSPVHQQFMDPVAVAADITARADSAELTLEMVVEMELAVALAQQIPDPVVVEEVQEMVQVVLAAQV
jgi:hypothetical protein